MVFGGSTGPDMALRMGQDLTEASEGIALHPYQAVPHYPRVPSSISPHLTQRSSHSALLLFLFYLAVTYLLILVAPRPLGVWSPLGPSLPTHTVCHW